MPEDNMPNLPKEHLGVLEQACVLGGNSILLTGAAYGGKKNLAKAIFAALNCSGERGMAGEACGRCPSCQQLAEGAHPDLLMLSPAETTSTGKVARRKIIPIGAIVKSRDRGRDYDIHVLEFLEIRPRHKRRCVLIDGAEFLGTEAANALLKLMEEPPHGALFLLLAGDVRSVMPTLVSRPSRLQVPPVGADTMQELGRGLSPLLLEFAAGRVELLAEAEAITPILQEAAEFDAALRSGLFGALERAAGLESNWGAWHAQALRFVWRNEAPALRAKFDEHLLTLEEALEMYGNPALSFMEFVLNLRAALGMR